MQVSVITPVGPRWDPEWLRQAGAVRSVNEASVCWIVVCNGSDPGEVGAAIDGAVTVLDSGPTGTARARNVGLAAARTTWCYPLDADDVPIPGGLDLLLAACHREQTVWAAAQAEDVAADGETVLFEPPDSLVHFGSRIPTGGWLDHYETFGVWPALCSGATVFRADVARAAGGWDEQLATQAEDIALLARISHRHPGAWSPARVLRYRKHPGSVTAAGLDVAADRERVAYIRATLDAR